MSETPEITPEEPTDEVIISDAELNKLRREATDFKDKYQRALAESENSRKRMQKERQELIQYALQNVLVDFLNPIDHLENALQFADQASPEVKHWAMGFQMILNQFKDVLANNGVTAFKSAGTHFDPHLHEAVETITTTEYSPGTIVSESLKGYKMGDRTLRPARVQVAKAPKEAPLAEENLSKNEEE